MNSIKVDVTKEAQDQVRELIKNQEPGTAVRVYLELGGGGCGCGSGGGGCGGGGGGHGSARFGMAFDQQKSGDHIVKVDGFSLLVDDDSAEMLDGAQIDFVQSLDQTGFRINAPKLQSPEGHEEHPAPTGQGGSAEAGGGCGCGSGGCG